MARNFQKLLKILVSNRFYRHLPIRLVDKLRLIDWSLQQTLSTASYSSIILIDEDNKIERRNKQLFCLVR